MPTRKDSTYTHALLNLYRNAITYSNWWKIAWTWFDCISENYLENNANLKQGAHTHQPTAEPVPHACAQPYHAGSRSHGQLFRPYWGSSAWHSRRSVNGANPCIKDPFLLRGVLQVPTHGGAVGWEPHSSSPTTCTRKADHGFGVCMPFTLSCLLKIVN